MGFKLTTPEIRIHRIEQMLEHWEARYNAEYDLIPGAPVVTASDMAALEMIRDLLCLVEDMQDSLDRHQSHLETLDSCVSR